MRAAFVFFLLCILAAAHGAENATNSTATSMAAVSAQDAATSARSATYRLFDTLLATFGAVFLGYSFVQAGIVVPSNGEMKGLSSLIGKVVLPVLVFKTMALAQLGTEDYGLLGACTLGRLIVMAATFLPTWLFYRTYESTGQRMLTATVFTDYVMSANVFAIGFPVVDALYGSKEGTDMEVYIAANSLIGAVLFTPLIMVLYQVGDTLKKQGQQQQGSKEFGGAADMMQVVKDIFTNPVILMTFLGLAYKVALGFTLVLGEDGKLNFPHPLSNLIKLVASPFSMCALFLTGASLKEPSVEPRSLTLVTMKVLVSAYVTYALAGYMMATPSEDLHNFSFLYGMLPTGSGPLVCAVIFSPESTELVATSILLGLVIGGPFMFCAAFFLEAADVDMTAVLGQMQFKVTMIALLCGICVVLAMPSMRRKYASDDSTNFLLLGYTFVLIGYEALMLLQSPDLDAKACAEFNEKRGRTWLAMSIDLLQNAARLLVIAMQVVQMKAFKARGTSTSIAVGFACLALAGLPVFFSLPSTLQELCSLVPPSLGSVNLTGTIVWLVVLFGIMTALSAMIFSQTSRKTSDDGEALVASGTAAKGGAKPKREWVLRPEVRAIVLCQMLRLFVQAINSKRLMDHDEVMGAFALMLFLESSLEHGQLIVLFMATFPDLLEAVAAMIPQGGIDWHSHHHGGSDWHSHHHSLFSAKDDGNGNASSEDATGSDSSEEETE